MAATNLTARSSHASRANLFAPALLAQLVEHLHGKEGVDGSSPSEGSAKAPHVGAFSFRPTCSSSLVQWVWSRLWSFRVGEGHGCARSTASESPHQLRNQIWMSADKCERLGFVFACGSF